MAIATGRDQRRTAGRSGLSGRSRGRRVAARTPGICGDHRFRQRKTRPRRAGLSTRSHAALPEA